MIYHTNVFTTTMYYHIQMKVLRSRSYFFALVGLMRKRRAIRRPMPRKVKSING
jgi:hypothetical protein